MPYTNTDSYRNPTPVRTRFFRRGALRDVYVVTQPTYPYERWLVCVWRDTYHKYRVQAKLLSFRVGPILHHVPGVLVPAETPSEHTSLAGARERARDLLGVLSHSLYCTMRDHRGTRFTF